MVTHAEVLEEIGTFIFMSASAGRIIGLKDNEWGHIGVKQTTYAL